MKQSHVIDSHRAKAHGEKQAAPTFADIEAHVNAKVQAILAAPMSDKALADLFAGPQPFEVPA